VAGGTVVAIADVAVVASVVVIVGGPDGG
jgi:hypothetical protein